MMKAEKHDFGSSEAEETKAKQVRHRDWIVLLEIAVVLFSIVFAVLAFFDGANWARWAAAGAVCCALIPAFNIVGRLQSRGRETLPETKEILAAIDQLNAALSRTAASPSKALEAREPTCQVVAPGLLAGAPPADGKGLESATTYLAASLVRAITEENTEEVLRFERELRDRDPAAPQLRLARAYHAITDFLGKISYSNENERKRKEEQHRRGLNSAIDEVRQYAAEVPGDPDGWLLLARLYFLQHDDGWANRSVGILDKAIAADSRRRDLRFYRGELLARAFTPSSLSETDIRTSAHDLVFFIGDRIDCPRAYRFLAATYKMWADAKDTDQLRTAARLSEQIADVSDGRWRQWHRRGRLRAALACVVMTVPCFGLVTRGAAWALPLGIMALLYAVVLVARGISLGSSHYPFFWVESKEDREIQEDDWTVHVPPAKPDPQRLRQRLDMIEEQLGLRGARL